MTPHGSERMKLARTKRRPLRLRRSGGTKIEPLSSSYLGTDCWLPNGQTEGLFVPNCSTSSSDALSPPARLSRSPRLPCARGAGKNRRFLSEGLSLPNCSALNPPLKSNPSTPPCTFPPSYTPRSPRPLPPLPSPPPQAARRSGCGRRRSSAPRPPCA